MDNSMPMDCTIIFVAWMVVTNWRKTYVCADLTPLQKICKLLIKFNV